MKKKAYRQDAIRMIISTREIASQEELLRLLTEAGFELTQATLSRDLKQLKVAKTTGMSGKYIYVLPDEIHHQQEYPYIPTELLRKRGYLSLQFSKNIAVVRTRPGHAGSIAYDIDSQEYPAILGTIAGDDTIMMVLHEDASHEEVTDFLESIFPYRG